MSRTLFSRLSRALAALGLLSSLAAADLFHDAVELDDPNFLMTGQGDLFGEAIAPAGDLNGDGNPDVVVGTPSDDTTGSANGAIWVLLLNADGTILTPVRIEGGIFPDTNYEFGRSVANIGDLDGDGTNELAVGHRDGVSILYMTSPGVFPHTWVEIGNGVGGFSGPGNDDFGAEVASVGDFDGDGVVDLLVGAPEDDEVAADAGAVWLLHLRADGSVRDQTKIRVTLGIFSAALAGDHFGAGITSLGDWNGDGVTDLAVGAPEDDDGGASSGSVYVLLLDAIGQITNVTKLSIAGNFQTVPTILAGSLFGSSLALIDDLDGNGKPDLAVGAPFDAVADQWGTVQGAVFVLSLDQEGTVAGFSKLDDAEAPIGSATTNATLGTSLAVFEDLDGDGLRELLVGSPGESSTALQRGTSWVLFCEPFAQTLVQLLGCGTNNANLGFTGVPLLGSSLTFLIDNIFASQNVGALPLLLFSLAPAPDCGVPMPGWNANPAEPNGELMILPPYPVQLLLPSWQGAGNPSQITVPIPDDLALLNLNLYVQGLLYDPAPPAGGVQVALTNGWRFRTGTTLN